MATTHELQDNPESKKNNPKTESEVGHARNVANLQKLIQ